MRVHTLGDILMRDIIVVRNINGVWNLGVFSIQYIFADGKKVKGWLRIEGVGGVGLGIWAERWANNDHLILMSINGHSFSQFIDHVLFCTKWIMRPESNINSRSTLRATVPLRWHWDDVLTELIMLVIGLVQVDGNLAFTSNQERSSY